MTLCTFGYRGVNIEKFLPLCEKNELNVVDVRSYPYSRFFPDYDREKLEQSLNKIGLQYRNYEPFGARRNNKLLYTNGQFDFAKAAKDDEFVHCVNRLINAMNLGYRFILLCSEPMPEECHRAVLVARAFYDKGIAVNHLIAIQNGFTIVSHRKWETKMREKYGNNFYTILNQKIGYKR